MNTRLKVKIDWKIIEIFCDSYKNKSIEYFESEESKLKRKFMKFLIHDTDLFILNYPDNPSDDNFIFFNNLYHSKDTEIKLSEKFDKTLDFEIIKDKNIRTIYFLNETDENNQKKYREKYGFLFGFNDNYLEVFKNLILYTKIRKLVVNKGVMKNVSINEKFIFSNWENLNDYFTPLTDIVIIDRYIFSENLEIDDLKNKEKNKYDKELEKNKYFDVIKKEELLVNFNKSIDLNFLPLIKSITSKTNSKFNLLIHTIGIKKSRNDLVFKIIEEKLKVAKIDCNLSIVFSSDYNNDHDRAIITNYLWVESGDTFNYFKDQKEFKTKGTKLEFHPLSNSINFIFSHITLDKVHNQIKDLEKNNKDLMLFGDYKANKLLKF